jgi:hypothetical protein
MFPIWLEHLPGNNKEQQMNGNYHELQLAPQSSISAFDAHLETIHFS